MDERPRRTITRRSDEPKLKLGDIVSVKEGVVGVVLARYLPADQPGEVHYVVELRPEEKRADGPRGDAEEDLNH